jgi:hypothetical protein
MGCASQSNHSVKCVQQSALAGEGVPAADVFFSRRGAGEGLRSKFSGQNDKSLSCRQRHVLVPTDAKRRSHTMIKKVKGGYKVVSEKTGKNLGGPYKTKAEAEKRLRQVEFFKHKGKT